MGRPIKKEFIGKLPNSKSTLEVIIDEAYIPGASSVSTDVSIVNQKGTGIYTVTDGTNTGRVKLVSGDTTLVAGLAHSKVTIPSPTGELAYTTKDITLSSGGSGYVVGDTITVGVAGSITVSTVTAAVTGGEITSGSATPSAATSDTDPAGTGVSSTGGTGTGATFNVTSTDSAGSYTVASITLNAIGSGYVVGDVLTIGTAGTYTVSAVTTAVTGGTIETFAVTKSTTEETTNFAGTIAGTGGTGTGASFVVTTNSGTEESVEYSRVIFNRTVSTFEGNNYSWNLDGTEEATLATKTRS